MSEYQMYDFVRLEGTLTSKQREALRRISTRAQITNTRFRNEYQWGDLKADPRHMLAAYFDAFLYLAGWGTRWVMLKFPATVVPLDALKPYLNNEWAEAWEVEGHTILSVRSREDEEFMDYWKYDEALGDLVGLRDQILTGDYRALFLLWLDGLTEDAPEMVAPPVPAGLGELDEGLMHLVNLFEMDMDLIDVAAKSSPPGPPPGADIQKMKDMLSGLTEPQKDALLLRVLQEDAHVRAELLALTRQNSPTPGAQSVSAATLLEQAREMRQARELAAQKRKAKQQAKKAREQAKARQAYLKELGQRWDTLWDEVYGHIDKGNRKSYSAAANLLVDMLEAAPTTSGRQEVHDRVEELKSLYERRYALIEALTKKGL